MIAEQTTDYKSAGAGGSRKDINKYVQGNVSSENIQQISGLINVGSSNVRRDKIKGINKREEYTIRGLKILKP